MTMEFDELVTRSNSRNDKCSLLYRKLLYLIMLFILVGGMVILFIGIWTHEVNYGSRTVSTLLDAALYQVDSVIMIVCGSITIFIMIIGLLGVFIPQKCLLGFHLSIMTFTAFGLCAAGILGYVFIGEIEVSVKRGLEDSVREKYGLPIYPYITEHWDDIQTSFACCGASGNITSHKSWFLYQGESFWYKDKYSNGSLVPDSCCDKKSDLVLCTGRLDPNNTNSTQYENWAPYGDPNKVDPVNTYNYTIYTDGCYDKLRDYLKQNGILIGTAAIIVAVFMIVEILMAIFEYRKLPN
ncbi:tetraspanin-11-like [Dreissena polymorpha]|uniref:Tetraspanin n=1 Tax=Dreissena polymorpha TaxID=45954 RepID=A0A9D4BJ89_DREPO|nr:tetraspanin-11-like [Dreissena polymorpha]XP_052257339.1 tetraspanin-11-like [Dreissena polymorpha]KAH3697735.1 hypothetical protein DPMN_085245 [Dreissena polymorpha]